MSMNESVSSERRARGRWDHLCHLTGLAIGGKQTGWDRLTQAILDNSDARLRAVQRLEAIVSLCRLLTRLNETHFVVLALRYGLTVDDQDVAPRSRQEISEKLSLSVSRVAQLEHEAIADLRRRVPAEIPALAEFVYSVGSGQFAAQ
jgi:DNA-directed RNA polymerase sigma subunit (sigma70/sigma32)